jgi:hypothetical protein
MRVVSLAFVIAAGLVAAPVAGQQRPAVVSIAEYVAALDVTRRTVLELDERRPDTADRVVSTVPPGWTVSTPGRDYAESIDWLLVRLHAWRQDPSEANKNRLLEAIDARRAVALAAERPAPDVTRPRADLDKILSAREFSAVHGPTWFDGLRAKAAELLLRLLAAAFGSSAVPTVTRIFVYLLAATAIVLVSALLVRALRRSAGAELSVAASSVAPEARPWQQWQRDANAAAALGNWRDAVHFAYWCGIAFLEAQGAWKTDGTRTPREYVSQLPDAHVSRGPLATFTRLLERVWYGTEPAAPDDFGRALIFLEQLGCPSR